MDCGEAEGYCKHAVAFLGWLQRRSLEKSVTSTTSYWKKARLSNVPMETKTTALETLRPNPRKKTKTEYNASGRFITAVLESAPEGTTRFIFDHLAFKGRIQERSSYPDRRSTVFKNRPTVVCYHGWYNGYFSLHPHR